MDWIFQGLRPWIRGLAQRPWPVIFAALLLSVGAFFYASRLTVESDLSKLIPEEYESVQALRTLQETLGGESEATVAIESPSFAANRRFAETLIPAALAMQGAGYEEPYFTRIAYRRDVSFLEQNALYFATGAELDSLLAYLRREREQARLEANPFYVELENEGTGRSERLREEAEAAYRSLVGREYQVSDDSTTLVLRLYPAGAETNLDFTEDAYADLRRLVDRLDPVSFHPEMEVTLAGEMLRQLIEVRTITDDVFASFGTGVAVLLLLVMAYFFYKRYQSRMGGRWSPRAVAIELARAPLAALVIGGPLAASLTWTFAVAYAMYGTLNIMTATLGLVLFGLGIDFGIHVYARYLEERGEGSTVEEAIEHTFLTTGEAVTGVAVTTAAAFYVLVWADFRGFSEFGFIAGTGILFALLAMIVLLPAVVAGLERTGVMGGGIRGKPAGRTRTANGRFPGSRWVLVLALVAVGASLWVVPQLQFEYHFGSLDPEYEEYNRLNRRVRQAYSDRGTRNAAYIVADRRVHVPEIVDTLRSRMARDTTSPTIRAVESLLDRFPFEPEEQQRKLVRIDSVRALLADPFLEGPEDEGLERLRRAASTEAPISIDEIPVSVKQPFLTRSGEVGNVILIYPSVGLSHGKRSMEFADDVGAITTASGTTYHAAATSIVASDMLRLMQSETPWMVVLTIGFVVLFKFIILRRIKWVLLALVPLGASFAWMFGLMVAVGWKLNFYNLVVLPTVLGIGDDSGIHVVHRYLEEGKGSLRRVLRSTGEHISMSAVTTMVGFGGLILSLHPGMRTIGEVAVLGIGMTLVAALLFLPALIQVLEDRDARPVGDSSTEGSVELARGHSGKSDG